MRKYIFPVIFSWCWLWSQSLAAQACCSGGTPLSGVLGLEYIGQKTLLFELNYDYNTQSSLVSGDKRLEDDFRKRDTHSVLGRVGYAFNERWMALGLWSVVQQEEIIQAVGGGRNFKRAQGLGDAVFFLQYSLLNTLKYSLLLGVGVETPLGKTTETDERTGLPLHPDLQPGRGAWSILNGARFSWYGVLRPSTQLMAHLTYRFTTPADRYQGLLSYQFGNELRFLAGLSDQLAVGTIFLEPSLFVLYRHTSRDKIEDIPSPNTGGHWFHLRPGVQCLLSPNLQLGGFWEFPLWWNLNETQLTTTMRFRVSARYLLAIGD